MATISVSNQSQFLSALQTAKAGDSIKMAAGNYGTISLDGTKASSKYLKYSDEVTIVSASSTNKAVINGLTLNGVTNMTFKNVAFDFVSDTTANGIPVNVNSSKSVTFTGSVFDGEIQGGYGSGTGIKLSQGSDILIENSTFTNYRKGIEAWAVNGLDIKNNKIQGISYDGVVTGHVQNMKITGNTIAMKSNPAEDQHRDGIQIWNQGTKAPSSNVTIDGNTITSTDTTTHGIYMGNADAKGATNPEEFYTNVSITNNTILTGQKLGIAIGQTDGITISGNTLIQTNALNDDTRAVTIPLLHLEKDVVNATISGNILNGAPVIADENWNEVLGASRGGLTESGNTIVKLSWNVGDSLNDPWADIPGNGVADEFRLKGTWVAATDRTDTVSDLSFDEGDTIVLINYETGSFKGVWQGNPLEVNGTGTYAKIDSITDLQELTATSPKLTASVDGDTLTLHVTQSGGTHDIILEGLGQEYLNTYDATLF